LLTTANARDRKADLLSCTVHILGIPALTTNFRSGTLKCFHTGHMLTHKFSHMFGNVYVRCESTFTKTAGCRHESYPSTPNFFRTSQLSNRPVWAILRKFIKYVAARCSHFNAKMHQIQFRLGLCPIPCYGRAYSGPPYPLVGFKLGAHF